MKETIVINNDNIKEYIKIELITENLESFEISINNILDINLIYDKKRTHYGDYFSSKGYIKLKKDVGYIISEDSKYFIETIEDEIDYRFVNRIPKYLDIVAIKLYSNHKKKVCIDIPYDLIESNFGGIIEYSNCHSFELDEDGNIIIKYGEYSNMPQREELYFEDIVENWKNVLPNFKTNIEVFNEEKFYFKERHNNISVCVIGDIELDEKDEYDIILGFDGVTNYAEDITEAVNWIEIHKLASGEYFAKLGYAAEFKFKRCYVKRKWREN